MRTLNVIDFASCPPRMMLFLAEIALENGNRKLYEIWIKNYLRLISGV